MPKEIAKYTALTCQQKLHCMAVKYFQNYEWIPKAGDYFTTARADLKLFQITRIDGRDVFTINTAETESLEDRHDLAGFSCFGQGSIRVYVPDFILEANA